MEEYRFIPLSDIFNSLYPEQRYGTFFHDVYNTINETMLGLGDTRGQRILREEPLITRTHAMAAGSLVRRAIYENPSILGAHRMFFDLYLQSLSDVSHQTESDFNQKRQTRDTLRLLAGGPNYGFFFDTSHLLQDNPQFMFEDSVTNCVEPRKTVCLNNKNRMIICSPGNDVSRANQLELYHLPIPESDQETLALTFFAQRFFKDFTLPPFTVEIYPFPELPKLKLDHRYASQAITYKQRYSVADIVRLGHAYDYSILAIQIGNTYAKYLTDCPDNLYGSLLLSTLQSQVAVGIARMSQIGIEFRHRQDGKSLELLDFATKDTFDNYFIYMYDRYIKGLPIELSEYRKKELTAEVLLMFMEDPWTAVRLLSATGLLLLFPHMPEDLKKYVASHRNLSPNKHIRDFEKERVVNHYITPYNTDDIHNLQNAGMLLFDTIKYEPNPNITPITQQDKYKEALAKGELNPNLSGPLLVAQAIKDVTAKLNGEPATGRKFGELDKDITWEKIIYWLTFD